MVDRRGLLDTGKEIASSAAGTFKSAAGTLSDKASEGASKAKSVAGTLSQKGQSIAGRTRQGVKDNYDKLTDDTVTDQEEARLERVREEALQEARQKARQEYQEEYRENLVDEAYDMELQELRGRNPDRTQVVERNQETAQPDPEPQPARRGSPGMAMLGVPQPAPPPTEEPAPQQAQPGGALFGGPPQGQGQPSMGLFGVPQGPPPDQGSDQQEPRRDPLFGMQF